MTDKTPLTAHAGSRSWELRFGDEVMARVSTTFTMQAEFAQQVTLRYNAHEDMLAALHKVLNGPLVHLDGTVEPIVHAAIAKAEGRKP